MINLLIKVEKDPPKVKTIFHHKFYQRCPVLNKIHC